MPNTYTVPFRGGLLIYVVPPGKRSIGMVDMVGVQRQSLYPGSRRGVPVAAPRCR